MYRCLFVCVNAFYVRHIRELILIRQRFRKYLESFFSILNTNTLCGTLDALICFLVSARRASYCLARAFRFFCRSAVCEPRGRHVIL